MQTFCLATFPLHWHKLPMHYCTKNNMYESQLLQTATVRILQTVVRNSHSSVAKMLHLLLLRGWWRTLKSFTEWRIVSAVPYQRWHLCSMPLVPAEIYMSTILVYHLKLQPYGGIVQSWRAWNTKIFNSNQTKHVVIMVTLCNRADHYIFILWFLLLDSFFLLFFLA